MSTETQKTVVRQYVTEAFFEGDADAAVEHLADDFVRRGPDVDEVHGPEVYGQLVRGIDAAFSETDGSIEAMVAEGDEVMYRWRMDATHDGEFMGSNRRARPSRWPGWITSGSRTI